MPTMTRLQLWFINIRQKEMNWSISQKPPACIALIKFPHKSLLSVEHFGQNVIRENHFPTRLAQFKMPILHISVELNTLMSETCMGYNKNTPCKKKRGTFLLLEILAVVDNTSGLKMQCYLVYKI